MSILKKKFSGSKIFNKKKNNKYEKMNLEKKIEINIKQLYKEKLVEI